jgi:hypothetical protein
MVVACIALFVALAGTAMASLIVTKNSQVGKGTISGHHPPSGDHSNIIGGSINGRDIAAGAVGGGRLASNSVDGSKVVDGSLTGSDVQNGSLGGAQIGDGSLSTGDIQDNGLTGADISEGTLAEVPSAKVGGFGRSNTASFCNPGSAFIDCVVLTVNLPQQSKVLLIGSSDGAAFNADSAGRCKLVTQFGDVANTLVEYSLHDGDEAPGSLVGITGQLGPGSVDFGIDCDETGGDMRYIDLHLTALQIAPD